MCSTIFQNAPLIPLPTTTPPNPPSEEKNSTTAVADIRRIAYEQFCIKNPAQPLPSANTLDALVESWRAKVAASKHPVVFYRLDETRMSQVRQRLVIALFLPTGSIFLRYSQIEGSLYQHMEELEQMMNSTQGADLAIRSKALSRLYETFLAPIMAHLPPEFTAVVPEYLPIPPLSLALVDGKEHLFQSHSVSYLREFRSNFPTFHCADKPLTALLCYPSVKEATPEDSKKIEPEGTLQLPTLKSAHLEANILKNHLVTGGYQVTLITGEEATNQSLVSKIGNSTIVHIGSHGCFDANHGFGAILHGEENLHAHHIKKLTLLSSTWLVTLGCCKARPTNGMNFHNLEDSFLEKDVPVVISPTSQIDDATAAYTTMIKVYSLMLADDIAPARALQQILKQYAKWINETRNDSVNHIAQTIFQIGKFVALGDGAHKKPSTYGVTVQTTLESSALVVSSFPSWQIQDIGLKMNHLRYVSFFNEFSIPAEPVINPEKNNVLLAIQKLFNSHSYTKYLQFSGEAETTLGNWKFEGAGNNNQIAFEEIVSLWESRQKKEPDSELFLICDADSSGIWAQKAASLPTSLNISVLSACEPAKKVHANIFWGGYFSHWFMAFTRDAINVFKGEPPKHFPLNAIGIPDPLMTTYLYEPAPGEPPQQPMFSDGTPTMYRTAAALFATSQRARQKAVT